MISIVMPIFNAECFLSKAIDSVINQTLKDWELLLIDDGSNDSSLNICNEYAIKDTRIKVIHQKNKGVSIARKVGIELAQGEYSIHVDADDWIDPTALEDLYIKAKTENADIVISDYFINENNKQFISRQNLNSFNPNLILIEILNNKLFGALWNKLIRTNLYKKYNAQFFHGINYCEDVLICAQILKHLEVKVAYLNKAFYHYTINNNSITHKISRKSYESRKLFQTKLYEILVDPIYKEAKSITTLGIFVEGFMNNCLTKEEIHDEFIKNQYAAFHYTKSLRWLVGYFFIKIGWYKLAHRFIKY
jgi:glycosyltransferase involved in cell wall biosynthesis